jgi:hypothetical protein
VCVCDLEVRCDVMGKRARSAKKTKAKEQN